MGEIRLGQLDTVEAIAFGNVLILDGTGSNPTSGWKNWFEYDPKINLYEFKQELPSDIVLEIVTPFQAIGAFHYDGATEISLLRLNNNEPEETKVTVREPVNFEKPLLSALTHNRSKIAKNQNFLPYRYYLGHFDVPGECFTPSNPFRAKRHEIYLVVYTSESEDIKSQIEDCLRQSTIATVLASLLTFVGYGASASVFCQCMTACLTNKLHKLVRVEVEDQSHCV